MILIRKKLSILAFATGIFIFSNHIVIPVNGQEKNLLPNDAVWVQKDLPQIIRSALSKPPVTKTENEGSLLLIPIVASNPATGFMLGIGGQYALKFNGSDRYSSFNGSTQFTSKGQKMFFLKNSIYTRDNKFYLNGDWRFMIFSQPTYGLGTNAPEGGILDYQFGLGGIETTADSIFDFAVNAGIKTTVLIVQSVVGTKTDGIIGEQTLKKLNSLDFGYFQPAFTVAKITHYISIIQKRPTNKKYLFGWIIRALEYHS